MRSIRDFLASKGFEVQLEFAESWDLIFRWFQSETIKEIKLTEMGRESCLFEVLASFEDALEDQGFPDVGQISYGGALVQLKKSTRPELVEECLLRLLKYRKRLTGIANFLEGTILECIMSLKCSRGPRFDLQCLLHHERESLDRLWIIDDLRRSESF